VSLSFGPPTDPAYTRFLEGLHRVAAAPAAEASQRWHGADQSWYPYDPAKWGMEDVGAIGTAPESALSNWAFTQTWTVNDFAVPELFERVKKAFASLQAWHPKGNFVWSPSGGSWRVAFQRVPSIPVPPVKPTVELPPEAKAKIAMVEELERRGALSHSSAQQQIARIFAEYT
jgi:hypothetical protein